MDCRTHQLNAWLSAHFHPEPVTLTALTGDASFRRYYRAQLQNSSFVVMDAPPDKEPHDSFVAIADLFKHAAVRFPRVVNKESTQGFLLLTDFGDQQLLPLLHTRTVGVWYKRAIRALLVMQSHAGEHSDYASLPSFDYWREYEIFVTWYLQQCKGWVLSAEQSNTLRSSYHMLVESALLQPQVFVHRDYHSRNLMVCADGELAVLDFQDAVWGPITYDLVSLLRDCYIDWPSKQVEQWARFYYDHAQLSVAFSTFLQWFDWMGLQRHLKCLGIFARLSYRDQKHGYLKDMPRVLQYARQICDRYPQLSALKAYLS